MELVVAKEDFKFSCAHFIVHKGFREKLHGHNYRVSLGVKSAAPGADGYVIDFGVLKKAMRKLCSQLDEHFLCPMANPDLTVSKTDKQLHLVVTETGDSFSFPLGDTILLPVVNITVEALSTFLAQQFVAELTEELLLEKGVTELWVGVTETAGQEARCTLKLTTKG